MLLVYILGYLVLTLGIGVYASTLVRNSEDFILAGRRLPLSLASVTIFATWFGSETILGASATFAEGGILAVIEEPFGAALCLILVGLFVARPMYKLNLLTFGDFYKVKFGQRIELIAAICLMLSYFGWTAAQLVAMGIIFEVAGGLSQTTGIWVAGTIVLIYTYLGGMWAISLTDFLQSLIIIIGLVLTALIVIPQAGGWVQMTKDLPSDFFYIFPRGDFQEWSVYLAAWITIGLGSIPQQDVYQRVMSSKSADVAVRASLLAGIFYLTLGLIPLILGLAALRIIGPTGDYQTLLPTLILQEMPFSIQILFFGALISAILSTASGSILASSVIFSENLIKSFYPNISSQHSLMVNRLAVIIMTSVGLIMALGKQNIYELVGEASIISLVSLFTPMCAGLYTCYVSEMGAFLAIVMGLGSWYLAEYIFHLSYPPLLIGLMVSALAYVLGYLIRSE